MTQEEKSTFIRNLFKLLIGSIFLVTCFWYLKDHPAEKIALYSGFKNIIQKGHVLAYNLIGKNGELLAQKYELENDYLDAIHLAEEKGCIESDFLQDLHTTYETFLREDKDHIENYITKYKILHSDYMSKIWGDCGE